MNLTKSIYDFLIHLAKIFWDGINVFVLRKVPVVYFDGVLNAGDQINVDIFEWVTGRTVYNTKSRLFKHYLGVGSILFYSNERSVIWGSGFIDENTPRGMLKFDKVVALRGELSRHTLDKKNKYKFDGPLGDPALLMPRIFNPGVKKKYRVGIVPHYAQQKFVASISCSCGDDVKIIDIKSSGQEFIKSLLECEVIISSSLHGLILSDAYGIQNCWVQFQNGINGGQFKFRDYYSTTNCDRPEAVSINNQEELVNLLENINDAVSVKEYKGDLSSLLSAIQQEFK